VSDYRSVGRAKLNGYRVCTENTVNVVLDYRHSDSVATFETANCMLVWGMRRGLGCEENNACN